jgi:hypothetical protein
MKILMGHDRSLLEAIMALIGRSPIAVAKPIANKPLADLPAGFTDVDFAVLDWIAAEGRRIGRDYALH